MLPIRTERSTFIHRTSDPDIPDMPGERIAPGHIRSVWEPTMWERDDIFHGGNVDLNVFAEPIPPASLGVTGEGAKWGVVTLSAARQMSDDGRWYVRLTYRGGVRVAESKAYGNRWSAWLAQRRLKKILPSLEVQPTS